MTSSRVRISIPAVLKRWEMRVSINYTYLTLANVMTFIIIGCHWVANIWGLQASFNYLNSWPAYPVAVGSE